MPCASAITLRDSEIKSRPSPHSLGGVGQANPPFTPTFFPPPPCDIQPCPHLQTARSWPKRTHRAKPHRARF